VKTKNRIGVSGRAEQGSVSPPLRLCPLRSDLSTIQGKTNKLSPGGVACEQASPTPRACSEFDDMEFMDELLAVTK